MPPSVRGQSAQILVCSTDQFKTVRGDRSVMWEMRRGHPYTADRLYKENARVGSEPSGSVEKKEGKIKAPASNLS